MMRRVNLMVEIACLLLIGAESISVTMIPVASAHNGDVIKCTYTDTPPTLDGELGAQLIGALNVTLPSAIGCRNVKVATRKKLNLKRKKQ